MNLSLHVHARKIPNEIASDANPVAIWKVVDERDKLLALISNESAIDAPPRWWIKFLDSEKEIKGHYFSPLDAFEVAKAELG